MRLSKKVVKVTSIVFSILLVLLVAFNFWFKAHARRLIEEMVETRSNGKLRLKMEKFHFNWFSKKMEVRHAIFYSTDSTKANATYRFYVDEIKLEVDAILPIVFKKRFIIDSITLMKPNIEVTKFRSNDKKPSRDVSIPEEMGKIYNSIQDALRVLRVTRFMIEDGTFTLINKVQPDALPITIGNLFFQIDNLRVDTTIEGAREKILFSDNVILRSHNQDIIFPDGRHRLSFSKFRINLQKRSVEFDSCTIAATRGDSARASFTIFMDALRLIDIDFDTLYKAEVIKADSVYAVNPRFDLEVELVKKKDMSPPKLENIIKQLTGDLQLNNVIVSNADFNIKTIRDGVPSSFTFSKNNFEMQGLTIDQEAERPLKVKGFAMAIRNYENFLRDSSYSVQFDSVLFRDDRIYLSNFLFHKLDRQGRVINSFKIPQFYLGGLSWDELVFDRRLKADQATLFNPQIEYTVSDKQRRGGKQNIFQSLAAVNEFMDIQYLDIIDGTINFKINNDVQFRLEEATLSIQSHDLLTSTQMAGIKNSLTQMDFKRGVIHAGDLKLELDNILYLGETGKFDAGELRVIDKRDKVSIVLGNVAVKKMLVDEKTGDIYSEDISWQQGDIRITATGGGSPMKSLLEIKRVNGKNTQFKGNLGNAVVSANFQNMSFTQLDKLPGKKIQLSGLAANGTDLSVNQQKTKFSAASFLITDNGESNINGVILNNSSEQSPMNISFPSARFIPHVQPIIDGKIVVDGLIIDKPQIDIQQKLRTGKNKISFPALSISSMVMQQPDIQFSKLLDSGIQRIYWKGNTSDFMRAESLQLSGGDGAEATVKKLMLGISGLKMFSSAGNRLNASEGKIEMELQDLRYSQTATNDLDWHFLLSRLNIKNIWWDSLGKTNGRLYIESGELKDLALNPSSAANIHQLSVANASFLLHKFNGNYIDDNSRWRWYNMTLSRRNREFTLDSLSGGQRIELDSFLKKQQYQADYLNFKTGPLKISQIDLDAFIRDRTFTAGELVIDDAYLSDYRDNTFPFRKGIIKHLPVALLQQISTPLMIERIHLRNMAVDYTEVSEKLKTITTIPLRKLDIQIENVKNFDADKNDSLDVRANAVLLDTVKISLHLKQSYLDPANFLLSARIRSIDLRALNPILVPMAGLQVKSGYIDSIRLKAISNDYMARGEMKMQYHDLKLRLMRQGDTTRSRGFMNFLANTLVKNKNGPRTGIIFQERDRERSVFKYLVKILMSGFTSSIGVKSGKKQVRKHKTELNELELPEGDWE